MNAEPWLSVFRSFLEKDAWQIWRRTLKSASFSQFGEDLFYARTFTAPNVGFYVDVGAAYPILNSNTYRLYLKGWRGVTIEPNPEFAAPHARLRPRDAFVRAGVSDQPGELDYYCFGIADFNTFDRETALAVSLKHALPNETIKVQVDTLTNILDRQNSPKSIDFMSIDCEGFDLSVLRSLDWDEYTISILMIEDHSEDVASAAISPTALFLAAKAYNFVSRINYTSVFVYAGVNKYIGGGAK